MSEGIASLPRDVLSKALGGDPRAIRAFEQEGRNNATAQARLASSADATELIQDATVIVLSSNGAFTNERVLNLGSGISAIDDGETLTLYADDDTAHVTGGFPVNLVATQRTTLVLPTDGLLATTDKAETLAQKTLHAPSVSEISDYADDPAAAAGNVPIGGVYRTGSALKVRVA